MEGIAVQLQPLWPRQLEAAGESTTKYSSSLKVWDNKPDFEAKLAKLTQSIKDSRGKVKDVDSLKSIVTSINQTCDSCHETYQVRNR